jgi:branched-chain amino acid transport system substrate-binding protein
MADMGTLIEADIIKRKEEVMKRYIPRKVMVYGVAIWALWFISLPCTQAANPEPVKIGLITDLTGAAYVNAIDSVEGGKVAVDRLNAGGGILGRKVELLVRDSALKTDLGVSHARELIMDKKVNFMMGPISSGVRLAISDVCRVFKVPLIDCIGGSVSLHEERGHDYFWQISVSTAGESYGAAVGCAKLKKVKTIVTLAPDYVWGRQEVEGFMGPFQKMRPEVKVLDNFWPKLGEKDYTPYITAIIAKKPDLLYSVLYGGDWINFVKQAKPYGFFEKMLAFVFAEGGCQIALGKEAPEGTWGFARAPAVSIDTAEMKSFVKAFKEKVGRFPSDAAATTYDAVYAFKYGAEKAKSVDGPAWVKAMKGASVPTLRGIVKFRECDNLSNSPEFIGPMVYDPNYGFVIIKPVEAVDTMAVARSCEEIMELRKKAGK